MGHNESNQTNKQAKKCIYGGMKSYNLQTHLALLKLIWSKQTV